MNFDLTPRQTTAYDLAISGTKRVIVFGGAIRGGKTWWLLITLSSLALTYARSRWVVVRKSLPDLKRTTFVSFNAILDDGLRPYVRSWNQDTHTVTFINGSVLVFMAESFDDDKDLNRFKGLEINGAGLDEMNELQEVTFYKVQERMGSWNKAVGSPPIVCLGTLNPAANWVKTIVYQPWKDGVLNDRWAYIPSKVTDNPHLTPEYIESLKGLPLIQYMRFVEGDWDISEPTINPFLYEYSEDRHVNANAIYNPSLPLILSMDFNVNPLCGIFAQYFAPTKTCRIIDEVTIADGNIGALCKHIEKKLIAWGTPKSRLLITGDRNGAAKKIGMWDNKSSYIQIQEELRLSKMQFKLPGNPFVKNSRVDCNDIFEKWDITIHPDCKKLRADCQTVGCNADGDIMKKNRKNDSERADHMDSVRYLCNTFLK